MIKKTIYGGNSFDQYELLTGETGFWKYRKRLVGKFVIGIQKTKPTGEHLLDSEILK